MTASDDQSLNDHVTSPGASRGDGSSEPSLGGERTSGGVGDSGSADSLLDDLEIVDLEARYRVEGTLGQGGMGAVVLAKDTRLDRKVAIKRILGEAAGNRLAVARFLTEAKAIAVLNHPNIVQIYDYGRAKDGPFLIMEYVDGGSLADRCRQGPIPVDEAIDLACRLCDGLAKAHDAGIVHRDIKPANILLTREGVPKLTDFGLAKAEAADHGHTMTGAVLGTPDFMPPEQRRTAAEVDARSDLWSLAATVYQMVTGRSPKVIRLRELPDALEGVIGKGLEEDKQERFQSAQEFRIALLQGKSALHDKASAEILQTGECPKCKTKNDPARKYCRECAASLETPCLRCATPGPVWEDVCGQCGARQAAILEELRAEAARRRAAIEEAIAAMDFDAAAISASFSMPNHSGLMEERAWFDAAPALIADARRKQHDLLATLLREAHAHEAAHDYPAAIEVLERIPKSMMTTRVGTSNGVLKSCKAILLDVVGKHRQCQALEGHIRQAVSKKHLDGLLAKVRELRELLPGRKDVATLLLQLEQRERTLQKRADQFIVDGHQLIASGDFDGAVECLNAAPKGVREAELNAVRNELWRRKQEADVRNKVQDALACVKAGNREQAVALIESIPKQLRSLEAEDLLGFARGKQQASILPSIQQPSADLSRTPVTWRMALCVLGYLLVFGWVVSTLYEWLWPWNLLVLFSLNIYPFHRFLRWIAHR